MQNDNTLIGFNVLNRAVIEAENLFGPRLLACYALGSLAHGGFSPKVSDIDFAIIIKDSLQNGDDVKINHIKSTVAQSGLFLAEKLSIFWSSLSLLSTGKTGGRFPLHDRLDLIEHGKKLSGISICDEIKKPTKKELVIDSTEFALKYLCTEAIIQEITHPEKLISKEISYIIKIILLPIRLHYTAQTGKIGQNQQAVTHYLKKNQGCKAELVESAFHWRDHLPHDKQKMLNLIKAGLCPIYLEFLDEFQEKMHFYSQPKLAHQLRVLTLLRFKRY